MIGITVVVASAAGGEFVFRCLDSLRAQVAAHGACLVVVDRVGDGFRVSLRQAFPEATVIAAPATPAPTIPAMRRIGVDAADTPVIAILEEHCVAPAGWLDAIASAWTTGDVAIGGPIAPAPFTRTIDWVVYFSEYHNYMPSWTGDRTALNGANIAYDRSALVAHRPLLDAGYWEVVLHPLLAREGRVRGVDAMTAVHTGPFETGYYLRQRYLLSRVWGGTQRHRATVITRIAHVVLAPIVPFVMTARIAQRVRQRPDMRMPFLRAMPLLFVAMCTLAFGEALGYIAGEGRALEEVE